MTEPRRPLDIATDVLRQATGDEIRVQATHRRAGLTRFAESHIHQHVGEDATHVSLTVVRDGRVAEATTTDITSTGLARLVQRAQDLAGAAPVDPGWPGLAGPQQLKDPAHTAPSTQHATGADRAAVVQAFVEAGGANAAGYCETDVVTSALVDSAGGAVEQRSTRATLDGIHRLPSDAAGSGHHTSVSLAELDGAAAGAHARRLADLGDIPADFSPSRVPVVLGPEAVATLAIFLSAYGFNGKSVNEGQSGIRVGDQQFDDSLDLVDDPLAETAITLGFDMEGTARRRIDLIRAGVSSSVAHDRRSAAQAATSSTGHAAPGSTSYGPVAANLALRPSASATGMSVADLAAGMERGLLVTAFNYCRILDPKSIGVTGLTRNGTFLVEDGRIIGSVGNLRFTQSFVAAVQPGAVVAIGDDARFADSEFGPAMAHVPSLHLASWNMTGDVRG